MTNFVKSGDNLTLAAPTTCYPGAASKVGNVFGVARTTRSRAPTSSATSRASTIWQGQQHVQPGRFGPMGRLGEEGNVHGGQQSADRRGRGGRRNRVWRRCESTCSACPASRARWNGVKVAHATYDYSVDGGGHLPLRPTATPFPTTRCVRRRGELHCGGDRIPDRPRSRLGTAAGSRAQLHPDRHRHGVRSVGCGGSHPRARHPIKMTAAGRSTSRSPPAR